MLRDKTRRYFDANPTSLNTNQVFVFGSNLAGFHGAGAAGFAMRGTYANTWRNDSAFRAAMIAPVGSPKRIGIRAVYGIGHGLMYGYEGMSYAIPTVTRPGRRRSIALDDIYASLKQLGDVAAELPQFEFLCNVVGGGYNGYSVVEIAMLYVHLENVLPLNVVFPRTTTAL